MKITRALAVALVATLATSACSSSGTSTAPTRSTSAAPSTAVQASSTSAAAPSAATTSAGAYRPMSAAQAAAVVSSLRRLGWQCFASLSTPVEVDRCFLHPGTSTSPTRGTVYLVHTRSRAAGGGPLQSAEIYGNGVGNDDGSATARPVAQLFATRLLGSQVAALTTLPQSGTIDGIAVVKQGDFAVTLTDDHLRLPAGAGDSRVASIAAVRSAVSHALPSWTCDATGGLSCTGTTDGSPALRIRAGRDGATVSFWTIGPTSGRLAGDNVRALLRQEIAAGASAGIVSTRQQRWLREHVGRSLDADIDGQNLGLTGSRAPVLTVSPVALAH